MVAYFDDGQWCARHAALNDTRTTTGLFCHAMLDGLIEAPLLTLAVGHEGD